MCRLTAKERRLFQQAQSKCTCGLLRTTISGLDPGFQYNADNNVHVDGWVRFRCGMHSLSLSERISRRAALL
jgi:hypothetical protein